MSFDEPDRYAADFDWDDVDPGDDGEAGFPEDWEDEPHWGDEPHDNWHWYDDPPRPAKEEPDCYVCNDNGGRCCEPTRLDLLRWRLRSRARDLLDKLRRRPVGTGPDEPPF